VWVDADKEGIYAQRVGDDTLFVEEESEIQVTNAKLKVYPNPFVYKTVVSCSFLVVRKNQRIEVKTYDLAGRIVEKVCLKTKNQKLKTEIGENLSSGVYFVKVKIDNKMMGCKKIIKIRGAR
jgi:hypothetical protein